MLIAHSYTLTSYLEFYLCFQNGGEVWTNDVPVEAGVSEVYLELKNEKRGEKQLCQYTEEKPGDAAPAETDITVYVKSTAGWKIVNIYAWDDHDGASTNMEWKETPMEDLGNGWRNTLSSPALNFTSASRMMQKYGLTTFLLRLVSVKFILK